MFRKVFVSAILFTISAAARGATAMGEVQRANREQVRSLIAQLSANPPGQCVQSLGCSQIYDVENQLFRLISQIVLQALRTEPKNPESVTNDVLDIVRQESDALLRKWPDQNHFAFKASYSETGGGWRSLFVTMKIRTESTTSSFTYTPPNAPAGVNRARGQWELDWVSTRITGRPLETFSVLVKRLAANPPADCSGAMHNSYAAVELEDRLFELLGNAVLDGLNNSKRPASSVTAARAPLERFKAVSDEITKSWRSDRRFRYQLFSFQPLIVLKLGMWNQDSFVVYAPVARASTASRWAIVHSDGEGGHQTFEHLQISSLWRGPSNDPRFLAIKHFSGCMAGMTPDYVVKGYEWHIGAPSLMTILSRKSSFSEEGPAWKFDTAGKTIEIPYCWSGPLELGGASAPICSVDTYDLSGNLIRFVRAQDDPEDLALIARVMKYAEAHDGEALNALCTSPEVARQILALMPVKAYFVGFQRTRLGKDEEVIEFEDEFEMKVTLKRANDHWKVAAFTLAQNY